MAELNSTKQQTPLMRQYWDIKSLHTDKIVLFRLGDFYEMFFDDAIKAAPILGITLTARNKKSEEETPMCGVPYHSIGNQINKLLAHGLKVAICDQVEDPKATKGIVKRAVTRILTPGMVYDSETLEHTLSHYIACLIGGALACVDTTTGESFYYSQLTLVEIERLLQILPIAELVVLTDLPVDGFSGVLTVHQSEFVAEASDSQKTVQNLLSYIEFLGGKESLKTLQPFHEKFLRQKLGLSSTTVKHLELFLTYKNKVEGSLFHAVNRTKTSFGARQLRQWICFPLVEKKEIMERQNQIEKWFYLPYELKKLREIMGSMGDIERRLGKITQPQCNARDLVSLAQCVESGLSVLEFAKTTNEFERAKIAASKADFIQLAKLSHEVESTVLEDAPLTIKQGYMIKKGVDAQLDDWITLSTDSQSLLQKMEDEEKKKTGINSLKIRYNNVFGYYIEITNLHKEKVPSRYMRKQTLAAAERYCTDELIELEKKVLAAQSKRFELEYQIFENLREKILKFSSQLLLLAQLCSDLDVVTSLAWLAIEQKYIKPTFTMGELNIRSSRHPVIEQFVKKNFIANDIHLQKSGSLLLTGPNMAGKSTLMRQVALTVVLAQMGSFVPADSAELPVFDQIFTRIGASDNLSEGLSTFMVEMTETSEILQKATEKSLIVMDEIGRGTSTFDGMSLAQAILEHILSDVRALTLFATHYHELTNLEGTYKNLKNAHMSVSEKNNTINFQYTLKSGPALKSYGIQVAQLAGLPPKLVNRARALLKSNELAGEPRGPKDQLSLLDINIDPLIKEDSFYDELIEELKLFPVHQKTPIEAMIKLAEFQSRLQDDD